MRLLGVDDRAAVERYVLERGLVRADAGPIAIARAGAGNMNLVLRVTPTVGTPFILKQGRPWVEKYPHISAPAERTLVEAAFYAAAASHRDVAMRMPALLNLDVENYVLALEDLGEAGDLTSLYNGAELRAATLGELLEWLDRLAGIEVSPVQCPVFANREMRALNLEHMFRFPLAADHGLDLDAITPGLKDAARELVDDREYRAAVDATGRRYLADGATLVHGDYFPGSWMHTAGGVRVIDPEFCFLGDAEFDLGILVGHLLLADAGADRIAQVTASAAGRRLDLARVARYAGVEIMRRLIGVAQLPLPSVIDRKRALLRRSRRLVLDGDRGLS